MRIGRGRAGSWACRAAQAGARAREMGPGARPMTTRPGSQAALAELTAATCCSPARRPWTSSSFSAFPSWFLRIECDRCGRLQMVNQAHMRWDNLPIRDVLDRMRHDGCGGRAGRAELLTGIEGASSRPVRKITLIEG